MNSCSHCQTDTLIKAGLNRSGSQRYQCKVCKHYVTLEPKPNGYAEATRRQALQLYLEGNGLRRIGRILQTAHQTIANWVNAAHAQMSELAPQPRECAVIELDELFTFVGQKKTKFTWPLQWIGRLVASSVGPWYNNAPLK